MVDFLRSCHPPPPSPSFFLEALAEKISQTTGHLGEAKAFCAKVGVANDGKMPRLGLDTLPETNRAPKNGWLDGYKTIYFPGGGCVFFTGELLNFRDVPSKRFAMEQHHILNPNVVEVWMEDDVPFSFRGDF